MAESEFIRILGRTVEAALAKLEFKCWAKFEDILVERSRLQQQLAQAIREVDSLRAERGGLRETWG